MTLDLFSSIRSSGSSASAPAEGDESEVRAESRGLGWDDSSVISEMTEEEIDLAPAKLQCSVLNLTASSPYSRSVQISEFRILNVSFNQLLCIKCREIVIKAKHVVAKKVT